MHGQLVRDVGDELDVTAFGRGGDDLIGTPADMRLELGNHPRSESHADEPPQSGMLGWIHRHDRVPATRGECRCDARAVVRAERLPIAIGPGNLCVGDDRPELDVAVVCVGQDANPRMAMHRAGRTQLAEQLVREPLPVERAVGEVELGDLVCVHGAIVDVRR